MSGQKLTFAEQETIILWDNGTDTAEVYTHDARLTGKLRELSQRSPEDYVLERSGPGRSVTYRIPKRCVGIRPVQRGAQTAAAAGQGAGHRPPCSRGYGGCPPPSPYTLPTHAW